MYFQQPSVKNKINNHKQNLIRVIGNGKVFVQPNQAEITLGVSTEDLKLEKAQKENARTITEIINALHSIGISNEKIRTVHYSVSPQYDYIEGKQIFRGYKVEHSLLVTVDHIESAGLVVDIAVKNGANIVSSIQFSVKDMGIYEQQAISIAVIDSIKKAESIASTLGVRLQKIPIFITEAGRQRVDPYPLQATAFVKSEASTPIQPGMLEINSQITAEFVYYS